MEVYKSLGKCAFNKIRDILSNERKKFHSFKSLGQRCSMPKYYFDNKNVESSIWFTTLPSRKKRALILNEKKKLKRRNALTPSGPLLVDCKRSQLNHYMGMQYGKFEVIPLASKGWHHRKSKGDYFSILPYTEHPAFLMASKICIPQTFEETLLSSSVVQEIKKLQAHYPTTIQAKSVPEVLEGKSVVIVAETGCGKTLAYLAPIVDNVLQARKTVPVKCNSPLAVIILPTRELAVQVGMIAHKLTSNLGLKTLTLLGGKTKKMLLNPVQEVTDLLVCTLGIFSKMLTCKVISMDLCKHLVLDEADTLLDDTFNEKLISVLRRTKMEFGHIDAKEPNISQLCLVSATKIKGLETLLENVIMKEQFIQISSDFLHKIQSHIPQKFIRLGPAKKPEELLTIAKANVRRKVPTMIFCNKTATTNWMSLFLNENGINSIRINGAMEHDERLEQYQKFRDGFVDVICCTDLISRGLDSTRVRHIINYEFPRFMADYVHRCGRTGRIGHDKGCLITNFISSISEIPLVQSIEKSARLNTSLENVNNNIARILKCKSEKISSKIHKGKAG